MTADRRTGIGGDYAIAPESILGGASRTLFASGRDALAAIAAFEAARGHTRWLLPEFICGVVPEALRRLGADVHAYRGDSPGDDARAGDVVLLLWYMGVPPKSGIAASLRERGIIVVEDRAQWIGAAPAPDEIEGDYAFGSIRKWLPVPDGAWCTSRAAELRPSAPPRYDAAAVRLAAALAKGARSVASDDAVLESVSVELFAAGEARFSRATSHPAAATQFSERVFAAADVDEIRARRLANQRELARLLLDDFTTPMDRATIEEQPLLAFPLHAANRDALRRRLREASIFTPIHWADGDWSGSGGRAAQWARELLSIPIDQRYTPDEMTTIARAIRRG